jgi:hypothetical protein
MTMAGTYTTEAADPGAGAGLEDARDLPARTPASTATFDYASLPPDIANDLKAAAARVRERMRTSILETGRELLVIKAKLVGRGEFGRWLAAEFGLRERTAENLMNAARLAENSTPEIISGMQPTVLYLLGAPSTPETVRKDALCRAACGERITVRGIKELISNERSKQRQNRQRIAKMTGRQREEMAKQENEPAEARPQQQARRAEAIVKLSALIEKLGSLRGHCIDLIEIIWPYGNDAISRLRNDCEESAQPAEVARPPLRVDRQQGEPTPGYLSTVDPGTDALLVDSLRGMPQVHGGQQ